MLKPPVAGAEPGLLRRAAAVLDEEARLRRNDDPVRRDRAGHIQRRRHRRQRRVTAGEGDIARQLAQDVTGADPDIGR